MIEKWINSVTGHQSPDISHRTSVTGHQSPDIGHRTSVTGHQSPDISHWTSVTGHQSPDISHWTIDTSIRCNIIFLLLFKKIDFIFLFQFSFHLFFIEVQDSRCHILSRSYIRPPIRGQRLLLHLRMPLLCMNMHHVPSALNRSMLPITNPSHAHLIHVPKPHADLAIKCSSVATTCRFPSACSVTRFSHIHSFNTSVLPKPFSLATSLTINNKSFSLKNKQCFLLLKPPSLMTNLSKILMHRSGTRTHKSKPSSPTKMISFKQNDNSCGMILQLHTMMRLINSFIRVHIRIAMASFLPLGNAPLATDTPARIAGNPRRHEMIPIIHATPIPSLLSHFLKLTQNLAQTARFSFTKPKDVTKCSAHNANAFGLGTLANLKVGDTILTTCNGCARIIPAECHVNPAKSCVDEKSMPASLFNCIDAWVPYSYHSCGANYGMMTLPKTLAQFPSCSIPFLICAFMICHASRLIASMSI